MTILEQIEQNINSQAETKRKDMLLIHQNILDALPGCKLWFDEGLNEEGKAVTNPTIGYGQQTLRYAKGNTKEFFQIGHCANSTGISIYILGLKDKKHLLNTYGSTIGKASVTGYCIKFKSLKDIKLEVLIAAIKDAVEQTKE